MDALEIISGSSKKAEVPSFSVGDTVKVHVKIKEGDKSYSGFRGYGNC